MWKPIQLTGVNFNIAPGGLFIPQWLQVGRQIYLRGVVRATLNQVQGARNFIWYPSDTGDANAVATNPSPRGVAALAGIGAWVSFNSRNRPYIFVSRYGWHGSRRSCLSSRRHHRDIRYFLVDLMLLLRKSFSL